MPATPALPKTRYFISPQLSPRSRDAARARIVAAGACIAPRLTRTTDFVVATAAECRAARHGCVPGQVRPVYLTLTELRRRLSGAMVIGLKDGEEHLLDLSSGHITTRFPLAISALPPLTEDEVTTARLEQILRAAGIRTSRDADDDLVAHAYGESIFLMVAKDRQFVRFVKLVQVEPLVSDTIRSEATRRLNDEFDVVRFRLWQDAGICADYAMSFSYGLVPAQMVAMLLGFSWVVKKALQSDIAMELLFGQG